MQSGSELENDGTRPVVRSEMSDEGILHGDFHAVGRAIEAVIRQRAMFCDFGKILRSLAFRIKAIGYSAQRQIPTRVHFKISDVFRTNSLTLQGVLRIMKTLVNEPVFVSLHRDCD